MGTKIAKNRVYKFQAYYYYLCLLLSTVTACSIQNQQPIQNFYFKNQGTFWAFYFQSLSDRFEIKFLIKIADFIPDKILCRWCGADLAENRHIINNLSPYALVSVNQTLFQRKGVEVLHLKSELGINFQSITLANSHCAGVSNVSINIWTVYLMI